jgi:hypothetical protein
LLREREREREREKEEGRRRRRRRRNMFLQSSWTVEGYNARERERRRVVWKKHLQSR